MHIHFLDPYRPRASVIHALDPRVTLILTLAYILATSLTPVGAWPIYVLLLALSVSIVLLSELGVKHVLKRSALAAPFVLAALPLLFTVKGPPLVSLPIGPYTLAITTTGLERFLSVVIKSWMAVQVAIVFSAATPFPDYSHRHARHQNSAPAGLRLQLDVALPVRHGRRSPAAHARPSGSQRRTRSGGC